MNKLQRRKADLKKQIQLCEIRFRDNLEYLNPLNLKEKQGEQQNTQTNEHPMNESISGQNGIDPAEVVIRANALAESIFAPDDKILSFFNNAAVIADGYRMVTRS